MLGRSRVRRNTAAVGDETVLAMASSHTDHLPMLEFRWLSGTHRVRRERTFLGGFVGLEDVFFETSDKNVYESTKDPDSAQPSHPCRIH